MEGVDTGSRDGDALGRRPSTFSKPPRSTPPGLASASTPSPYRGTSRSQSRDAPAPSLGCRRVDRAALAELRSGAILVLALETGHARGLPAAGAAKGRNRGPRLTAWESPGQEPEVGRAPGPLSGLSLSQVQAPCPPGVRSAPEPGDLLTVPTRHRGCFILWPHIQREPRAVQRCSEDPLTLVARRSNRNRRAT